MSHNLAPVDKSHEAYNLAVYRGITRCLFNDFIDTDFAGSRTSSSAHIKTPSFIVALKNLGYVDGNLSQVSGLPDAIRSMPESSMVYLDMRTATSINPYSTAKETVGIDIRESIPLQTYGEKAVELKKQAIEKALTEAGGDIILPSGRVHKRQELHYSPEYRHEWEAATHIGPYKSKFAMWRAFKYEGPALYEKVTGRTIPAIEPIFKERPGSESGWIGTNKAGELVIEINSKMVPPSRQATKAVSNHEGVPGHLPEILTKKRYIEQGLMRSETGLGNMHTQALGPSEVLARFFQKKAMAEAARAKGNELYEVEELINDLTVISVYSAALSIHRVDKKLDEVTKDIENNLPFMPPESIPDLARYATDIKMWPAFVATMYSLIQAERMMKLPEQTQRDVVLYITDNNLNAAQTTAAIDRAERGEPVAA